MGHVHKYPQKPTSSFMFLRGQATLYKRWDFDFIRQNMLAFHFIDSKHVAIPVYTRLFSIKSAAKHLASCTWGIFSIAMWGFPEGIPCSKAKFNGESLVGGLEHGFYYSIIGNNHPNWLACFFRGAETANQIGYSIINHPFPIDGNQSLR